MRPWTAGTPPAGLARVECARHHCTRPPGRPPNPWGADSDPDRGSASNVAPTHRSIPSPVGGGPSSAKSSGFAGDRDADRLAPQESRSLPRAWPGRVEGVQRAEPRRFPVAGIRSIPRLAQAVARTGCAPAPGEGPPPCATALRDGTPHLRSALDKNSKPLYDWHCGTHFQDCGVPGEPAEGSGSPLTGFRRKANSSFLFSALTRCRAEPARDGARRRGSP